MKKHYPIFLFILFIISHLQSGAQLNFSSGTGLKVSNGTKMIVKSNSDTLRIAENAMIENNGIIIFQNNSIVQESINFPIFGSGHEIAEMDTMTMGWNSPADLGFKFDSQNSSGNYRLYRYHSDTLVSVNGISSINRYFRFSPLISTGITSAQFHFDSTELNGNETAALKIISLSPSQISNKGGIPDNDSLRIDGSIDSTFAFTLAGTSLELNQIDTNFHCNSDSISIDFAAYGVFNTGNIFTVSLINSNDTIVLGTVNSPGAQSFLLNSAMNPGVYAVQISSSDLFLMDTHIDSVTIRDVPEITYDSLQFCLNTGATILNSALPTGGIYSGSVISANTFDPSLSGIGNFVTYYSVTDIYNCSSIDSAIITVYDIPSVDISTFPELCENANDYLLVEGIPSGGIYSGNNVTGNLFDPSIGSGSHTIYYSFTDTNSCTAIDSNTIVVNSIPSVGFSNLAAMCSNDSIYLLIEGSPIGGTYSGIGVTGSDFDPSVLSGNILLTYTFTDTNNCTNSDTSSILVNAAPAVPTITQTINTLSSSAATTYQWYLDGVPISGENSSFIDATLDGNYQVEITNGNSCSEISDPFSFFFNAIGEIATSNEWLLYPNPANTEITLIGSHSNPIEIGLYNAEGKLLFNSSITEKQIIALSDYPNGIYFIRINEDTEIVTLKFVITR